MLAAVCWRSPRVFGASRAGSFPRTTNNLTQIRLHAQRHHAPGLAHVRTPARFRPVAATSPFSSLSTDEKERRIESMSQELKSLERERDEAIATGESCAKTSVRLTDMVQMLEKLALEKVTAGEDESAKAVLKEKASVTEMLDKTNSRAKSNFALAAKIAEVIGQRQKDLLDLAEIAIPPAPPRQPPTPTPTPTPSYAYKPYPTIPSPSSPPSTPSYPPPSAPSYPTPSTPSTSYTPIMPRWERSLLEAKQRMFQEQQEGGSYGRAARLSAEESIAAARERVRAQTESINEAQARLRRGTEESIAEAQARLRRQEVEAMMYLQRLTERYRHGEYIPEDELELAFRQLKKL